MSLDIGRTYYGAHNERRVVQWVNGTHVGGTFRSGWEWIETRADFDAWVAAKPETPSYRELEAAREAEGGGA